MKTYLIGLYFEQQDKADAIDARYVAGDANISPIDIIKSDMVLGNIFAQMSAEEMRYVMDNQDKKL